MATAAARQFDFGIWLRRSTASVAHVSARNAFSNARRHSRPRISPAASATKQKKKGASARHRLSQWPSLTTASSARRRCRCHRRCRRITSSFCATRRRARARLVAASDGARARALALAASFPLGEGRRRHRRCPCRRSRRCRRHGCCTSERRERKFCTLFMCFMWTVVIVRKRARATRRRCATSRRHSAFLSTRGGDGAPDRGISARSVSRLFTSCARTRAGAFGSKKSLKFLLISARSAAPYFLAIGRRQVSARAQLVV